MVDKIEVAVTDLSKKHSGKLYYKGFFSLTKRTYQDDGEIVTECFDLDKENPETLRAKIMAILIDEMPKDSKIETGQSKSKQSKLS